MMHKGEINLLPGIVQKKRVAGAYFKNISGLLRHVVIWMLIVVAIEGIIFFVVSSINRSLTSNSDQVDEIGLEIDGQVRTTNQFLSEFDARLNNSILWTNLIDDIFRQVPPSITLLGISTDQDDGSIDILGTTVNRPDMLAFQKKIEQLEWVSEVEAPLSNLTVSSDETFKLKIHHVEENI